MHHSLTVREISIIPHAVEREDAPAISATTFRLAADAVQDASRGATALEYETIQREEITALESEASEVIEDTREALNI